MTLGSWLARWYSLYVDPSRLALSTKAMYRRAIDAVPVALGQLDLSSLSGLDLQAWLVQVAKRTPRAAQLDRCMLVKALSVAAKAGLCHEGICDAQLVPKPFYTPSKAVILEAEQVQAYLTAAQDSDCLPLLMLCLCGLRRGEALGARWQDLDGAYLTISRQRLRVARHYAVTQPKSAKAVRTLRLPDALLDVLAHWPKSMTGWIVDTTPEHLQQEHKHVITAADLPRCTLHGLRHTFATLAAGQGVSMKLLQVAMGHSKMQLTADLYADHLQGRSELPALVYQRFAAL